jgi:uncharacterized membrane protein
MIVIIAVTGAFLATRYSPLPELLPVHFGPHGHANGWEYKTPARVLMPVLVQVTLLMTLGGIGVLLLSRSDRGLTPSAPDVNAVRVAAEAVMLIAVIWIAFQAYAAFALVYMWTTAQAGLGPLYITLELLGLVLSAVVGARAVWRFGRPVPLVYVAAHWRLGQLYCNANDPALFVPTRDGSRWTLNFGRPAAVALLAVILATGIALPTIILMLALRS